MNTWYKAFYGSWCKGDCVTHIGASYNRKEIFSIAQETANCVGKVVTISAERPTGHGIDCEFFKIIPKEV